QLNATAYGVPVEEVSGAIHTSGSQLDVDQLTGKVGHSPFTASGSISHFNDPAAQAWNLTLTTDVHLNNLLKTLAQYKPRGQIHSP
ncbi:hypothetical protein ABTL66_19525, partial [Acinetobacter baumannii]